MESSLNLQVYNSTCILNPRYKLRLDEKRILFYYKEIDPPSDKDISNLLVFIHPVFAILLSLFDGKRRLKRVVNEFSYITGLKEELVIALISQLVENKTGVKVEWNHSSFYFPKNTLIRTKHKNDIIHYNPYDFLIPNSQLDFQTRRLYRPLDTTLILNNICVTRCIYCYADKRKSCTCQIPLTRMIELIREANKMEMRSFTISGGEIFTYRYWKEILKVLVENNFDPFITTKYPLNERKIKELKDIGIKHIRLSLDTIKCSEMCKLLNINEKYYGLILKTLENLDKNNFDIRIQSQVTSINQESMEEFIDYLLKFENITRISVRATRFSLYPKGDKLDYLSIRPVKNKFDEIKALIIKLNEKTADRVQLDFLEYPIREKYINSSAQEKRVLFENRGQCSGNFYSFHILPDGKVTICEELYWHPQFIIGDLMKQSINEVWNSDKAKSLYHLARDSIRDQSACKTCDNLNRCHQHRGVCWKQVLAAYGEENWDYPDPRCPLAPKPYNEFWIE